MSKDELKEVLSTLSQSEVDFIDDVIVRCPKNTLGIRKLEDLGLVRNWIGPQGYRIITYAAGPIHEFFQLSQEMTFA